MSPCAAIFQLRAVTLQYLRVGEVVCDLHDAHIHIISSVRDVTHVRKCTRPSTVLQAMGSWARAWEQSFTFPACRV